MQSTDDLEVNSPLVGIRILALEHAVSGPFCTRNLADLGAEVIKVERPKVGDFARDYDDYVYGQSSYFVWLNRSKKSIALDIKSDLVRPILKKLIDTVDVFVQNLAPGAAKRLGLDFESIHSCNPRCIVVDISGYGETGPFSVRKAYDMLIQAESGLMSVTGTEEIPSRVGISVADLATGMYAESAILAALFRRSRTGLGSNVKIAMLDVLAEWMTHPMYRYAYNGTYVPRIASTHPVITPYGAHLTMDGSVIFSVQNEREWKVFCNIVLEAPKLFDDPRFNSNNMRRDNCDELTKIIEEKFNSLTSIQVTELLEKAGIASGRLNDAKSIWEHEQLSARDKWRNVRLPNGESIRALLPPVEFTDVESIMGEVPELGRDTINILESLGVTKSEISALYKNGVIGIPDISKPNLEA